MADNLEELNKRTGDLQGLLVPGTSVQENTDAYKKIEQRIVTESEQKFSGRPANDSEKQAYIAKRKYELTIEYIATVTSVFLEKYKAENVGKAKVDAATEYLKKYPEVASKMMLVFQDIMKHGAETQQDIYGKALAKYQDDYWKKMADIIDRGVNAIISPHEAKVEMANLGIKFGMIMSGLGAIFGKDEWVETGSALAAQGENLATKEGEKILALTKTLRDEYGKLGKDWQGPDFMRGLNDLKLNYGAEGQEVFRDSLRATGYSTLKETILKLNELTGGKLLEDPVIRQHSFGRNGDDQPSGNNPKSVRLNNPGNIRDPKTGEFIHYPTKELGLAAMRDDLLIKIRGDSAAMERVHGRGYKPTIENIISVWAPPSENNTNAYIEKVARESGIDRKQVLQPTDVERIMLPMIHMEGGLKAYNNYAPLLNAKATVRPEFNENAPRIAGGGTGRSPDIDVVFLEEQKPGSKPADKGSFEHIAKIDPLKLTLEM